MASSLFPDPFKLWRDAVTQLEGQANNLATGSLQSQEALRSLHTLSGAFMGMQQMMDKALNDYLRRTNLPSRKDIAELAHTLQRIESKLDALLPAEAKAAPERPARTRRPPASATPATPPAPEATVEKTPPAKPARRPARRPKGA